MGLTVQGNGKKVPLHFFRGLRPGKGMSAIRLDGKDQLRWAHRASDQSALVIATEQGLVLRSRVKDFRTSSVKAPGKPFIKFGQSDDQIASCDISQIGENETVVVIGRGPAAAQETTQATGNAGETDEAKEKKVGSGGGAEDDDSDNDAGADDDHSDNDEEAAPTQKTAAENDG